MTKQVTILDGAMGTMLQASGLKAGERPETLCRTNPDAVIRVHRQYIEAGSERILTNSFCANAHKLAGTGFEVDEVVRAAVRTAFAACEGTGARPILDIGPIGELLEPLGTLKQEEAYELFRQMLVAGEAAGADTVLFETFSDLAELRMGVLAAKECTHLSILTTMTFEQGGRTFLGVDAGAAAMSLSALGVSALGVNCSLGPAESLEILRHMRKYTDLPLILKPNAGLPDPATGAYQMDSQTFAEQMRGYQTLGVAYIGGCCGTTPDFIRALAKTETGKTVVWEEKAVHGICSAGRIVQLDEDIHPIGERINPTGKKLFAKALLEGDTAEAEKRAITQEEAGAHILDINVGVPGLDEPAMMQKTVIAVSNASSLPLQIDSSNPRALEAGLRAAPGKCLINSVNASQESLDTVLPLAKKYGAAIVGLTLDGRKLPETTEDRIHYAKKIISEAEKYGIAREDILIDCLTLTVSAQQKQAGETLEALRILRRDLHVGTVLGVSNISFGLPERALVTKTFLTQALCMGLNYPIINPNQEGIMEMIDASRVLLSLDVGCENFVARHANTGGDRVPAEKPKTEEGDSLEEAILRGQADLASKLARQQLEFCEPLELAEQVLMPALDLVGKRYEAKEIFLPQLMNAASAAGAAFEVIREKISDRGESFEKKGPIVLATVEGDIHDIGKNIVKAVLENYGFEVIDLGKDVPPAHVCDCAERVHAKLVGLSALMTTTVPSMERTIRELHNRGLEIPTLVGGAVLTEEYAREIGADYYAKDAKASADIAMKVIG